MDIFDTIEQENIKTMLARELPAEFKIQLTNEKTNSDFPFLRIEIFTPRTPDSTGSEEATILLYPKQNRAIFSFVEFFDLPSPRLFWRALRNVSNILEKYDIHKIEMMAGDETGGYLWSLMGVVPYKNTETCFDTDNNKQITMMEMNKNMQSSPEQDFSWEGLVSALKDNITNLEINPAKPLLKWYGRRIILTEKDLAALEDIKDGLDRGDRSILRKIALTRMGKNFLEGKAFYGFIDLSDPTSKKVFSDTIRQGLGIARLSERSTARE